MQIDSQTHALALAPVLMRFPVLVAVVQTQSSANSRNQNSSSYRTPQMQGFRVCMHHQRHKIAPQAEQIQLLSWTHCPSQI